MIHKRIEGTTRTIGKSQGYLGLSLRDDVLGDGVPCMITAWEPTPGELEKLKQGAPVLLTVLGTGHPPVKLEVGEVP